MNSEAPASTVNRARPVAEIRAVIDVGTNSVKLLVGRITDEGIVPLDEASQTTRLGRGFYPGRILQADSITATARCVAEFARRARDCGAVSVRTVATSAAREAFNAAELVETVRTVAGMEMEIISGEQEAEWVFRGVMDGMRATQGPVVVMDLGGGSTEFIAGEGREMKFRESFPLGVVRLSETLKVDDPPGVSAEEALLAVVDDFLARNVQEKLQEHVNLFDGNTRLIGVGGTATVLAAMEQRLPEFQRERLDGALLTREQIANWCRCLWTTPLIERQKIPGLPPKRADVIITGAVIYLAVMRRFQFADLHVSTRGLRYAAILEGNER